MFPLQIYFEHRNYLPAVGAIWAILAVLSAACSALSTRMNNPARIFAVAAVALLGLLAGSTWLRAHVWSDQRSLLAQALLYHPDSKGMRLDQISFAMAASPPQVDVARAHAEYMRGSSDSVVRRLGADERLAIDCTAGRHTESDVINQAFDGTPESIEVDLMLAIENLSDRVASEPCDGLSSGDLADQLVALLGRSPLPASEMEVWRLRYRAANLYLTANRSDDALAQARLATAEGAAQPQVILFAAGLLLDKDRRDEAGQMIELAASQLGNGDTLGRHIVEDYRRRLQSATR